MTEQLESNVEEINQKLDQILKLMVVSRFNEDDTIQDKIALLMRAGFEDNQEMAKMIGTTGGTVRTEKSALLNDGGEDE